MAKADCEMPRGFRNSSSSISPGCVGGTSVGKRRRTSGRLGRACLVIISDFDVVGISFLKSGNRPDTEH
jgi:hypothetical protein